MSHVLSIPLSRSEAMSQYPDIVNDSGTWAHLCGSVFISVSGRHSLQGLFWLRERHYQSLVCDDGEGLSRQSLLQATFALCMQVMALATTAFLPVTGISVKLSVGSAGSTDRLAFKRFVCRTLLTKTLGVDIRRWDGVRDDPSRIQQRSRSE